MTQKVILLELVNRMYCLLVCSTSSFNHVPCIYTHNTYTHTHSHAHTKGANSKRYRVWCTCGSWGSHVLCVFICGLLFTFVKYTERYLNSIRFLSIVEFMHFTVDFHHLCCSGRGCMRSKLSLILLLPLMGNTLARNVIIPEANNTLSPCQTGKSISTTSLSEWAWSLTCTTVCTVMSR